MRKIVVVAAGLALSLASGTAFAQEPGDRPPPETLARLKEPMRALEQALAAKDDDAVYKAVEQYRHELGPYAGVPESPEKYFTPIDTSTPDVDTLISLWEELYRGQGARGIPGSGLGLALVRAIADRHGGQVSLRSREGQGTVFTLTLPIG